MANETPNREWDGVTETSDHEPAERYEDHPLFLQMPEEARRELAGHRLYREQGRKEMLRELHQHFDRNVETEKQKMLHEEHQASWEPHAVFEMPPSNLEERARGEVDRRYRSWIATYDRTTKQEFADIVEYYHLSTCRTDFSYWDRQARRDKEREDRERSR